MPIGDTLKGLVVLDWADVVDATGYNLDIDGPLGFWNVFPEASVSELIFRTSIAGEYEWKVRAYVNNDVGPFSTPRSFLVTGDVRPSPSSTPTMTPTPKEKSDPNEDGSVNHKDLFQLAAEWSKGTDVGDLNGDSKIDSQDFLRFVRQWHR